MDELENLQNRVEDLEEERKDLLQQVAALEQDIEILKDIIWDRESRITELEKWMEEAIASLQYVL